MSLGAKNKTQEIWNESTNLLRGQIDTHQFSHGCRSNLHDGSISNPQMHREEDELTGERFLLSRQQGKKGLQSGEVGLSDSQLETRRFGYEQPQPTTRVYSQNGYEDLVLWKRFITQKDGLLNYWFTNEVQCTFGYSV